MSNNAPQPKPASPSILTTDERRTIGPDLLLDGNLAWEKYKLPIAAAATLLVLGLVGSEFYANHQARAAAAASAQLDSAKTEADFQKVIDAYPGSQAAANAYLLLGRARARAKNYEGAARAWQDFADKFPQHALVPEALIGQASALEAQGKLDQARALYQRVATSYQNSYAAPLARLSEANLLLSQRKTEDAKHIYEEIMASSTDGAAKQQAEEGLSLLNVLPPLGAGPAVSSSPTPQPPATPVVAPAASSVVPEAVTSPSPVVPSATVPAGAPAAVGIPTPSSAPSGSPVGTP